jgi:molybdenum-dependent DNA-binding transcriptional regulator ModE
MRITTPSQLRASAKELLKRAARLEKDVKKEVARLMGEADARLKAADEIERQLGHADAPAIEKRHGHLRSRSRARH